MSEQRVTAVLGPTNTGKTHMAMERMLAHESGMIGFPLRLLARENYDRAVKATGAAQVALITGEEKITPPDAKYFLCTVESMPLARRVAFLAVDEIQMCADPDRGHVFTDRLLHARGTSETMFMGAETVRPLIRALAPESGFETKPRLSTLRYVGPRKANRLPPRSAVVAFSASDVYALAELVRRQRGGAAVVLGALSPRTRNAQVAMYQAGEVDYLVATDAIGMGLNMDVNHVAFAGTRKFDGRLPRELTPPELAQIAGRAGRNMNDGTFGVTADIPPLDPETIERIETHQFETARRLYWRNTDLRFSSIEALRSSLALPPLVEGLVRARNTDDELVLAALAKDEDVAGRATGNDAVRLLWDVCQIPDFRKVLSDAHARLLARIYGFLMDDGRLPTDWMANHVARVDRADGDIDSLIQRIADIRTWTYVSYHGDWLADAGHWQARTRTIEDKLSDALHERLAQRFVDRRTSMLVRRLKDKAELVAAVRASGEVLVEGHRIGELKGFRFAADGDGGRVAQKAVAGAAAKALKGEIASRVARLVAAPDVAFALDGDGISWDGNRIARLAPGPNVLRPAVEPLASDLLDADGREAVRARLQAFVSDRIALTLAPLPAASDAALSGPARGLAFQLRERLGILARDEAEREIAGLSRADRKALRALGVHFGRHALYFPALLKPGPGALKVLLWAVAEGLHPPPAPPPPGRTSVSLDEGLPDAYYAAAGFRPLGRLAVRIDVVERLSGLAWSRSRDGAFEAGPDFVSLAGCSNAEMEDVMKALGYRKVRTDDGRVLFAPKRKRHKPKPAQAPHPDSPFAALAALAGNS